MDRHSSDSGIAPEIKPELPEEAEEIVLSSDSEHSAEEPAELVIPGGEVLPGGFMDENIEVPVLQHIPEDNQEEAQPQPPPQNEQPEPANPEANPNQANNNMAAQGV